MELLQVQAHKDSILKLPGAQLFKVPFRNLETFNTVAIKISITITITIAIIITTTTTTSSSSSSTTTTTTTTRKLSRI